MFELTILSSGSQGNSSFIRTENAAILVDVGISTKQIEKRLLEASSAELREVQAIFITHEHGDHVRALPVLMKRLNIPIYCSQGTHTKIKELIPAHRKWEILEAGSTLPFEDLMVGNFAIPHDAYEPMGFVIEHALGKLGIATDLGYATKLVTERIRNSRALLLEANYDKILLHEDTKRPWATKQRISSRHGHLSNSASADLAVEVVSEETEHLILGHLSQDCNTPDMALTAMKEAFAEKGKKEPSCIDVATPLQPTTTIRWT